jgi:hypothetical protein
MQRFTASQQGVAAIDGKTRRRSIDVAAGKSPRPVVHAWCAEQKLLRGQLADDDK